MDDPSKLREQIRVLNDKLVGVEELHAERTRTVDGATLRWCRECQQNWPCPTYYALAGFRRR